MFPLLTSQEASSPGRYPNAQRESDYSDGLPIRTITLEPGESDSLRLLTEFPERSYDGMFDIPKGFREFAVAYAVRVVESDKSLQLRVLYKKD